MSNKIETKLLDTSEMLTKTCCDLDDAYNRIDKLTLALTIIKSQTDDVSIWHIVKCALDDNETLVLGY